jgi:hypothetical protein
MAGRAPSLIVWVLACCALGLAACGSDDAAISGGLLHDAEDVGEPGDVSPTTDAAEVPDAATAADAVAPQDTAPGTDDAEGAEVAESPDVAAGTDAAPGTDASSGDATDGSDAVTVPCAATCEDANACTIDACDTTTGTCGHVAIPGCIAGPAPCGIGLPCKTGVCDSPHGTCVGCVKDGDCDKGICLANLCNPAKTCLSDAQCKTTQQVCASDLGLCVNCVIDADCGAGFQCSSHVCKPVPKPCDTSKQCPNICDTAKGVCIGCQVDADCQQGQWCSAAQTCEADVCGSTVCADLIAVPCKPNGSGFAATLPCLDSNPCTNDACVPGQGCVHTANTAGCNDGDACTVNDVCQGGTCGGAPVSCDDNEPCTSDHCVGPTLGCQHTPNDAFCDDKNKCTSDKCAVLGGCSHAPASGPCDDGDLCTGEGACNGGTCSGGAALVCDDGNDCTSDSCTKTTGACVFNAIPGCTTTFVPACGKDADCAAGVCQLATHTCVACLDTSNCPANHVCAAGACKSAIPCVSDGGCKATNQVCALKFGLCVDCTIDNDCSNGFVCSGNVCVGAKQPCTSSLQCPAVCDKASGFCAGCAVDGDCASGQFCSAAKTCVADLCQKNSCSGGAYFVCAANGGGYGTGTSCVDGNGCTADICSTTSGCSHPTQSGACEDGNLCTTSDACSGGNCIAGKATACDDGQICTKDACDAKSGACVFTAISGACDDGNACTVGDACANGKCAAGTGSICDDGNACTLDTCTSGACSHKLQGQPSFKEFPGDGIDNNCDGQTDEGGSPTCDASVTGNGASECAAAFDVCDAGISTTFAILADVKAVSVLTGFGSPNPPKAGSKLVMISTGIAEPEGGPGYVAPQNGTGWTNSGAAPTGACSASQPFDITQWDITLTVPPNAHSFLFDFNFFSAEYPEYVGSSFSDEFHVILKSAAATKSIATDAQGNCLAINSLKFQACSGCPLGDASLVGTGYEGGIGGATGWLTTQAAVTPGDVITLQFVIFDAVDHIYDSAVLLDHFRWSGKVVSGALTTPTP